MINIEEFNEMDRYEKMQHANAFMLEAFQDFKSMMDALKSGDSDMLSVDDSESEKLIPAADGGSEDEQLERYQPDTSSDEEPAMFARDEEFPGRKSFAYEDLNPDDGGFYSGKEIGIPVAVAIRYSSGQDRLIPIQNSFGE